MRSDMWRLYRHILTGGIIISLACYGVIEWIQKRYHESYAQQQWLVDAELSAVLLTQSDAFPPLSPHSAFAWQVPTSDIPDADIQVSWSEDAGVVSASVSAGGTLFLTGSLMPQRSANTLPLLQSLLHFDGLSVADKVTLLNGLSSLSVRAVPLQDWLLTPLHLQHSSHGDMALVWQPEGLGKAWEIRVAEGVSLPITLTVLLIIVLAISALLVLVWIELIGLDRKRAHFETVTRQIARGRGTLPQGVVDSSGTLKELAYSFDSMSTHIQRLLKVQREMINAISHELRTPIARLRFGLEVLKDDVDDTLESSITALEFDVEELNTLVDEVLTYGKLEEGTLALNFEKTSIKQILDGIVEHNHALLQKFDVKVVIEEDDLVNADAHHLHRALQNLILNASKYASSTIAITFSADKERWQVDIEDDGPGIPIEDRDKVFIPFQRLDNSRTRASGGYGLGLAIVQRIAFWHGGAVLIDSSELGGAKFSFIWSRSQHQNSLS
ncbi:Sensor protein RstB [Marinomonas aquimarina]|uniref:histidine kinase n=1 Tax=Marinomonas aquimarina TaxID=295068 RepID=A0A1A8SZV5_9GAMM|nr:ATP-binding protein [Marinomonas aquimarina]SBS24758.1 Sensor protein RstB [Marinomonas aquimarina]